MTTRAFYVTQESLSVWTDGNTDPDTALVFKDNDDGLARFDRYLAEQAEQTSFMIVDVIEEEFAPDAGPGLGMRDRWNEAFWTLNLTAAKAAPLTAFIASYSSPEGLFYAKLSAASVMAIAPILVMNLLCN